MFDKPEVEVQERTIAMGAGHWLKRYAVIQNGHVKALFIQREEAKHLMQGIIWSWEEQE